VTTAVSAQRLAVLVDVQNIYYPAKSMGDKVNFQSLIKRFQGRQLIRAIAYVVEAPDVDVSPFVIALRNIGFEVRTRSVKVFEDGTRKGDIHLMLALDAMSLADKLDAVCLVTGDGEYVDLIHLLRSRGVRVEVMSFKSNTSAELLRVCDEHIPMNEEYLLGYSGPAGGREERFPDRGRALGERTRPLGYGYRERGGDGARGGDGRESRSGVAVRRDERYERYSGRPHRGDAGWRGDDRGDDRFVREGRELREPGREPEEAAEE
jgi:uncharacterized LabA/DUF88 family protein